jgi:hypothetical protein
VVNPILTALRNGDCFGEAVAVFACATLFIVLTIFAYGAVA